MVKGLSGLLSQTEALEKMLKGVVQKKAQKSEQWALRALTQSANVWITEIMQQMGTLQSLDWTSRLDSQLVGWTGGLTLKINFYADSLAYGVLWNPAAFCVAILWSWSDDFRPSVLVKVYTACNGFLIPVMC